MSKTTLPKVNSTKSGTPKIKTTSNKNKKQKEEVDNLIIDTNVLMDDPEALFTFKEHTVILAKTVNRELEKYKKKSFYEEHKIIEFDTLEENAVYEIIAVFKTILYTLNTFNYYEFTSANNEREYNNFISKCREYREESFWLIDKPMLDYG